MKLKRIYNHDAPPEEWTAVTEKCADCKGKGKVVNETADGLDDCPECDGGTITKHQPPVAGVEILSFGERQKFSQRLVDRGMREGWIVMTGMNLTVAGANKSLLYGIERLPGRYDDGTIHYYDCALVGEVDNG